MREIKFRAWHKIQKEMLWKLYLTFEGKIGIWTNDELEIDFDSNYPYLELMQFTGLKDKNGVEIYEGDIVRCNDGSLQEVYFNECAFVCKSLGTEQTDDDWMIENDDEVIGNIYETKQNEK